MERAGEAHGGLGRRRSFNQPTQPTEVTPAQWGQVGTQSLLDLSSLLMEGFTGTLYSSPICGTVPEKQPPVWTADRTKAGGKEAARQHGAAVEGPPPGSAGKQTWLGAGDRPVAEPRPPLPEAAEAAAAAATLLFKSNVAWKSLLQQLPLKPIVSSAPLTCQLLAAADGANTPRRAAIQFKITSPAQAAWSRPISRFHQIEERVSGRSLIMLLPKLKTKL